MVWLGLQMPSSSGMAAAPPELMEEISISKKGAEELTLPFPAFHLDRQYFGDGMEVNKTNVIFKKFRQNS